jgi:hypothetical protein
MKDQKPELATRHGSMILRNVYWSLVSAEILGWRTAVKKVATSNAVPATTRGHLLLNKY